MDIFQGNHKQCVGAENLTGYFSDQWVNINPVTVTVLHGIPKLKQQILDRELDYYLKEFQSLQGPAALPSPNLGQFLPGTQYPNASQKQPIHGSYFIINNYSTSARWI